MQRGTDLAEQRTGIAEQRKQGKQGETKNLTAAVGRKLRKPDMILETWVSLSQGKTRRQPGLVAEINEDSKPMRSQAAVNNGNSRPMRR